jgi:hypothetical protein
MVCVLVGCDPVVIPLNSNHLFLDKSSRTIVPPVRCVPPYHSTGSTGGTGSIFRLTKMKLNTWY